MAATRSRGLGGSGATIAASLLLLVTAKIAAEESLEQCLARTSTCSSNSGGGTGRPVCGSDDVTYTSRCQMMRAQCKGVTVKHRGKCRKKQKCFENREYARNHPTIHGDPSFMPTCRSDGSYAPLQCHKDTGYCWCVNAQGRPMPNTSVRRTSAKKPVCDQLGKSTTRRRSPNKDRRQKRICSISDKAQFNSNLIDSFQTEWLRNANKKEQQGGELDSVVLEWKFKDMDENKDGKLDKTEYRNLRKLVKKFIKPKRCSKSFARACDLDHDQHISQQEWADCLTRDGMNVSLRLLFSLNSDEKSSVDPDDEDEEPDIGSNGGMGDDEEEDYTMEVTNYNVKHPPPHGILQNGTSVAGSSHTSDESSGEHRDEDATDCFSDRKAVLNEQRSDSLYIPECTPDGRYKKIQCYKSVGYCWCVHEDTGKNIPGTSVKDKLPECDQIPASSRPMKGCPEPKKTAFLKDLMSFLHNRMIAGTNDTNIMGSETGKWQASQEEKTATWNFVVLDKNKNKVLERKEWKSFRSLVSSTKQLRRCGKKLPRYCDVNHDRKISLSEWLECLNTKRTELESIKKVSAGAPKVPPGGKNPITIYLKDD